MNFPANPTLNQTYTYGTRTWKWDGTTWNLQRGATALATVATTGSFTDLVNKPTTIAGYGIVDATAAIPKITSIVVTDSSYTTLDDTAVSTSGGYIKIIGTGFTTGSQVLINTTSASSVSFVSSTELRAQLPSMAAGTYVVYVVASDGSVAIRVNGITFSATPTWTTASTLPESLANAAISIQFAATSNSAVTYAVASGSTLPTGLSLTSGGLLSGTITGVTVATTYNFTINAIDQELQDSPRAFSISISVVQQIARSLRFNSADTPILERAGSAGGNRQTWTWSGWVKRSKLNTGNTNVPFLFGASDRAAGSAYLQFGRYGSDSDIDCLNFNEQSGGSYNITTEAKFRDMSAWYHVVCAYNTTQAVASDRVKIYVNGVLQTITSGSTYPPQNLNGWLNYPTFPYLIGAYDTGSVNYTFDGYMAEVNFIDGQQLTPTSFGESDPDTGVWRPVRYTGTYGTNGFYLNFSDNSNTTAATLGKDLSGNGNNFTPYNFSVAAGAGNDSLLDSPTSYGTDTGVGGEVRGNYCTLNPLANLGLTLTNGNLTNSYTTAFWTGTTGTMAMDSGTWYFEYTVSATASYTQIGVIGTGRPLPTGGVQLQNGTAYAWTYMTYGQLGNNSTYITSGISSATTNDIIMVAIDVSNGKIWFGKNGTWFNSGSPSTGTNAAYTNLSGSMIPAIYSYGTESGNINFGQRAFAYTAPSGFKALCSQNLPTPAIGATSTTQAGKYFNPVLYTGNGSTQSVTGVGFQPDFVWIKSRSNSFYPVLFDTVRGTTKRLITSLNIAEDTGDGYGVVSAFNSDGFSLDSGGQNVNQSSATYVAWNWKAGSNTVTNTTGSISAQVRANSTAGFSITTYTGNSTTGTVGHGLSTAPSLIIVKRRDSTNNWIVYSSAIGATQFLYLNTTDAAGTWVGFWGNTAPTNSVFTVSNDGATNTSGATYVAYCFAEIPGYSRFGSYVGNGSTDGPFVYCGFRPRWIMRKCTNTGGDWIIFDTTRDTYNVSTKRLNPNSTVAEATPGNNIDILSNGWKEKNTDGYSNGAGNTYIFAAFAETPFKYARAR
jgi:hypothetical protein